MKIQDDSFWSKLINMEFPDYEGQPSSTLYHNTKLKNLKGILTQGIKLSAARYADYEGNGIWTTTKPGKGYGGVTIAFNSTGYDLEDVSGGDFRVWQDVRPEDIIFVDFFVTTNNRISEVPDLIKRYGAEKVFSVLKKYNDTDDEELKPPFWVIENIINNLL